MIASGAQVEQRERKNIFERWISNIEAEENSTNPGYKVYQPKQ